MPGWSGPEALQDEDRLVLLVARLVREVVLGQSAYHPHDASSAPAKTFRLAQLAQKARSLAAERIRAGVPLAELDLGPFRRALITLRDAPASELAARVTDAEAALATTLAAEKRAMSSGVAQTYRAAAGAAGPLVFIEKTRAVSLGEWVRLEIPGEKRWQGQVIDAGEKLTVVQLLEDSLGLAPARVRVTFTGDVARATVGKELLGRAFNGVGAPIDGLPPPVGEAMRSLAGAPLNPAARLPPERLHRDRHLGHRRDEHAGPRAEAAHLLRARTAGAGGGGAHRGVGTGSARASHSPWSSSASASPLASGGTSWSASSAAARSSGVSSSSTR